MFKVTSGIIRQHPAPESDSQKAISNYNQVRDSEKEEETKKKQEEKRKKQEK